MLTGTANVDALSDRLPAPTIAAWAKEAIELRGVRALQVIAELRRPGRDALLPPALHPTDPPSLSLQAWRVDESEFGSFTLCFTRLSCRSGVRARGLTTAAYVDNPAAAAALRDQLGFPCRLGELRFDTHYDGCDLHVGFDGRTILTIAGLDPEPLGVDDVQYTSTLNLADTPNGRRLVQIEAHHDAEGVERVQARIVEFDAPSWGNDALDPYYVVTATVGRDRSISLPAVRFVCRADVSAFEGTETIGR
jgi:hypothetical protein